MKNIAIPSLLALVVLALPSAHGTAQVVLEKAVVAGGAVHASNTETAAQLTLGQPVTGYAGNGSINGAFGFWHESFVISSVGGMTGAGSIAALQIAPNPATEMAGVIVTLARAGNVEITLHDHTGRQVGTLYYGEHAAGDLRVPLDPSGLPSGIYHVAVQLHGALLQGSITIIR